MSTIDSKEIIYELLEHDGIYPGDPRCSYIFSYENSWGNLTQAVFWGSHDMHASPFVRNPQLLWSSLQGITEAGRDWIEEYKKEQG